MPEDFSMSKHAFSFQGSTEFEPLTPTTANRTWLTPCLFCWVYTAKRRLNTALLHTQMLLSLQKRGSEIDAGLTHLGLSSAPCLCEDTKPATPSQLNLNKIQGKTHASPLLFLTTKNASSLQKQLSDSFSISLWPIQKTWTAGHFHGQDSLLFPYPGVIVHVKTHIQSQVLCNFYYVTTMPRNFQKLQLRD